VGQLLQLKAMAEAAAATDATYQSADALRQSYGRFRGPPASASRLQLDKPENDPAPRLVAKTRSDIQNPFVRADQNQREGMSAAPVRHARA